MVKKKELSEGIIEEQGNVMNVDELKQIADKLDSNIVNSVPTDEDDSDSFYKNILNKLYDKNDVETKTEYLNTNENFVGTKLSFLAIYGNMPYLDKFVDIFERKRISLERKGRKEIIMALGERQRETQDQNSNAFKNMLGLS